MADTCPTDVRQILYRLAQVSSRPRYAFMVLNLISEVADPHGKAGPVIGSGPQATTVRGLAQRCPGAAGQPAGGGRPLPRE